MVDDDDCVVAYTDGSCNRHDKTGGWAFTAQLGSRLITRYGCADDTTNNEMELTAIHRLLEFVMPTPRKLIIWADSRYCLDALTKWWRKWERQGWTTATGADVKNLALIHSCACYILTHEEYRILDWRYVRGHSGNPGNERVDKLADEARRQKLTNWTGGNH